MDLPPTIKIQIVLNIQGVFPYVEPFDLLMVDEFWKEDAFYRSVVLGAHLQLQDRFPLVVAQGMYTEYMFECQSITYSQIHSGELCLVNLLELPPLEFLPRPDPLQPMTVYIKYIGRPLIWLVSRLLFSRPDIFNNLPPPPPPPQHED